MAGEHPNECSTNGLLLFESIPIQKAIEEEKIVEFRSVNDLNTEGPIRIHVPSDHNSFIDLSQSYIISQISVDPQVTDMSAAPVNEIAHMLWDSVEVLMNGVKMSTSGLSYAYQNVFQDILMHSKEQKETLLQLVGYFEDTAGKLEDTKVAAKSAGGDPTYPNKGYKKRAELFKDGKKLTLISRIGTEICSTDKYILPGVDFDFKFVKNAPAFYLMSSNDNPNCKIKIHQFSLNLRLLKVAPSVVHHIEKQLEKRPARYNYLRSKFITSSIGSGKKILTEDNLLFDAVPTKLVFALVREDAYSGNFKKNPLNFQHFDCSHFELFVNNRSVPFTPLNFTDGEEAIAYLSTQRMTGFLQSQFSNDLDLDKYSNGTTLIGFDLRAEAAMGCYSPLEKGTVRIKLVFKEPLSTNVVMITYGEYEDFFHITKERKIIEIGRER